jgi:hypothetical protein
VKPALRTALLLAAVVATGATACAPGVYTCACPASYLVVVCRTVLTKHDTSAVPLRLGHRSRRIAHPPTRSALPRPAGRGIKSIAVDAITISANCDRAPVVTVTPLGAARTLVVARGHNGGIAGLTLAQTTNTTIVVRAYRGHGLVGKATIPRVIPPPPPPSAPSPSPTPTSVPCRRIGHHGALGPQRLYCLPGPILPNAD